METIHCEKHDLSVLVFPFLVFWRMSCPRWRTSCPRLFLCFLFFVWFFVKFLLFTAHMCLLHIILHSLTKKHTLYMFIWGAINRVQKIHPHLEEVWMKNMIRENFQGCVVQILLTSNPQKIYEFFCVFNCNLCISQKGKSLPWMRHLRPWTRHPPFSLPCFSSRLSGGLDQTSCFLVETVRCWCILLCNISKKSKTMATGSSGMCIVCVCFLCLISYAWYSAPEGGVDMQELIKNCAKEQIHIPGYIHSKACI